MAGDDLPGAKLGKKANEAWQLSEACIQTLADLL
jgi:hypothetical protein